MLNSPSFDFLDSRYFVRVVWFLGVWFAVLFLWLVGCWVFRIAASSRKAGIVCLLSLFPVGGVLTLWRPVVDQILLHAIQSGDVPRARSALSLGAGVNGCTDVSETHVPSLEFAIGNGDAPMARLLIEHGANVNGIVGGDSRTLDYAEKQGQPEIVHMLRNAGAVNHPQ